MAEWLRVLSDLATLSYAVEALEEVATHSSATSLLYLDAGIVGGVWLVALIVGAITLRRQT